MKTSLLPDNILKRMDPKIEALLADPKVIFHVGVSGGKDSAAALLFVVRECGIPADRINATFCDTANEHEWTYAHVRMLSEKVHPIEWLKPKRGFIDLAKSRKRFPSTKVRFCTQELKIFPSQDHIQSLRKKGFTPVAVSGIRANESQARSRLEEWEDLDGNLLCQSWRPLIRWTLDDVLALHAKHGIPLNPLYAIGAQRVGCWPCIMSRKEEIRNIALRFPERITKIRVAEQSFLESFGRYSSFFPYKKVPHRFRSMSYVSKKGRKIKVATIDDVVRWSMTGKGAKGTHAGEQQNEKRQMKLFDIKQPTSCNSGYCE